MNLCLYTDSLPDVTLDEALDFAVSIGAGAIEIAVGGQSSAPHLRIHELLGNASSLRLFARKLSSRGLTLSALNCSAWPMHPEVGTEHVELMFDAIRLASELQVDKIVTMSGCPGDTPNGRTINWITLPWPPSACEVRDAQWEQAFSLWEKIGSFAESRGVARVALELIPLQLVYNVPTLLRLRSHVGPVIGANVDPSHLFWQQMDPAKVVRALGSAVHHVHLKDVEYHNAELALAGVLDSRLFSGGASAWSFTTIGRGHGPDFWQDFVTSLRDVGYDDVLSIENEDTQQPASSAVSEAAEFISRIVGGWH